MNDIILKKENDIYIYFEIIKQLEVERVLDVGMFLKRVGSVSRSIMNSSVLPEIELVGVDFFCELSFPVWNSIYNRKMTYESFCENGIEEKFDLLIALQGNDAQKQAVWQQLIKTGQDKIRYALFDNIDEMDTAIFSNVKVTNLSLEQDNYYLLDFGEK